MIFPALPEMPTMRTQRNKLFDRTTKDRFGSNQYAITATLKPIHVPSDMDAWQTGGEATHNDTYTWNETDCSWRFDRGRFVIGDAYNDLTVLPGEIGYRYISKQNGGVATVRLERFLDPELLTLNISPRIDGDKIWWDNVVPGVDIYLWARPMAVEFFKVLKIPAAPKTMEWFNEVTVPGVAVNKQTAGRDNFDRTNPVRTTELPRNISRSLEITYVEVANLFRETITGRTVYTDPESRLKSYRDEIAYPILVDQDITENIAADADDGYQDSDDETWSNEYGASGNTILDPGLNANPGFRYLTIAVGNSDTIDAGTLLRAEYGGVTEGCSGRLMADVDDGSAFSNGAGPRQFTETTSNLTVTPLNAEANTQQTWDVQAIFQDRVNDASWSSGSNCRFGMIDLGGSGYAYFGDYAAGGDIAVIFEINFTAGAAGAGSLRHPISNIRHHLTR